MDAGAERLKVPRLVQLSVRNYRALRWLDMRDLQPLTVLLGPNGSGKSTVFDVFAFLSQCFSDGLRRAWDQRGRFKELRTRGAEGPLVFELKYREAPKERFMTYRLEIDEESRGPVVSRERLRWTKSKGAGRPFYFLDFQRGEGTVVSGDDPAEGQRAQERLDSPELLAVNTLGQLARNPRVAALRRFITDWHLSYLTADHARSVPEAGPQERLSSTGDNLPNVIQYLREQNPDRLQRIVEALRQRVPRLETVESELLKDGRLLLQIKDAPFERPILARWASDGTLKMLAYLTLLYDPTPPQLIGIEEPENQLHPRLLPGLAEECNQATAQTQLMITTHSPFFVNGLQRPKQVWVLYRDEKGHAQAKCSAEIPGVREAMEEGAQLGYLWMEGSFGVGDPLTDSGLPRGRA